MYDIQLLAHLNHFPSSPGQEKRKSFAEMKKTQSDCYLRPPETTFPREEPPRAETWRPGERAWERATHHGAFVDGVEAHDGDVEEDGGGLVAALRGSHFVVVTRVVRHDVLELQRAVVHAALARAAKGTLSLALDTEMCRNR